jgi:hypothetical protein
MAFRRKRPWNRRPEHEGYNGEHDVGDAEVRGVFPVRKLLMLSCQIETTAPVMKMPKAANIDRT